jgi:hypothetical protein
LDDWSHSCAICRVVGTVCRHTASFQKFHLKPSLGLTMRTPPGATWNLSHLPLPLPLPLRLTPRPFFRERLLLAYHIPSSRDVRTPPSFPRGGDLKCGKDAEKSLSRSARRHGFCHAFFAFLTFVADRCVLIAFIILDYLIPRGVAFIYA